MTISLVSWSDHLINDGTVYEAVFEGDTHLRRARPTQVQPPGSWARIIRSDAEPRQLTVTVLLRSGTWSQRQDELSEWFALGSTGLLRIDEDGVLKEIAAVVVQAQPFNGSAAIFTAQLLAPDPRWSGVAPISSASLLTASGQGWTVTNPGNCPVDDAVITLRPVANKATGYLYMAESVIAWRAERPSGMYAVDITEGWAHDAEVAAGRSQADGDDIRVLVNGVEVPRWLGEHADNDANSTATKVWINLSFSPRRTAVLLNAVSLELPIEGGELVVEKGGTIGWPRQGAILVDAEVMLYTGRTESNADGLAAFTGITRAARNSSEATHSAATTCYWIEHRVQLVWGHSSTAAPSARADLKPLLDLTSSTITNLRHEWLNFADETNPGRSMQWGRRLRSSDDQASKMLAPSGSPATNMTFEYQSAGAVSGKPAYNTWYRDFPTGTGGSGSVVASITRALADTLGMWAYGVDGGGREIVLEKYSGALSSGSDNITEPTNPVYRIEFWAFNQVAARRPSVGASSQALTASSAVNGQQITIGSEPLDILAATFSITNSVGGGTLTLTLRPDSGADDMGSGAITTATYSTTNAGAQTALMTFSSPYTLQPGKKYWLCLDDPSGNSSWYYQNDVYEGGKAQLANVVYSDLVGAFTMLGRPGALADSFTRADSISYADDGDQVTIDGVTVYLATATVPYVDLKARQTIYRFVAGTLHNEATGQAIALNVACGMSNELQIRIGEGVAVNLDDELATSIAAGVDYSDPSAKFTLVPGDNPLRFVESGLVGVNALVEGFARWE